MRSGAGAANVERMLDLPAILGETQPVTAREAAQRVSHADAVFDQVGDVHEATTALGHGEIATAQLDEIGQGEHLFGVLVRGFDEALERRAGPVLDH